MREVIRDGVVIAVVMLGAGACASNPAQSSATVPLQIPEPPPRVALSPVVVPEPPPPDRPAPPPVPAAAPAPAPQPTASTPARVASPPPVPPEPAKPAPAPELRPAPASGQTPSTAKVLELLSRTKQKLDAITPARLNTGKRADYDSARRFLAQAEAAVKENNLMLAESSAVKAETLADGLR